MRNRLLDLPSTHDWGHGETLPPAASPHPQVPTPHASNCVPGAGTFCPSAGLSVLPPGASPSRSLQQLEASCCVPSALGAPSQLSQSSSLRLGTRLFSAGLRQHPRRRSRKPLRHSRPGAPVPSATCFRGSVHEDWCGSGPRVWTSRPYGNPALRGRGHAGCRAAGGHPSAEARTEARDPAVPLPL